MNRFLTSFTRGEKGIIAFVLAMVAVGYGVLDYQERQREVMVFQVTDDRPDIDAAAIELPKGVDPAGLIDVNTAEKEVLETLPGIGPALADRIIKHRTTNGPLTSMSDLDAVPGIGPAMMGKLDGLVTFGNAAASADGGNSAVNAQAGIPGNVAAHMSQGVPQLQVAPPAQSSGYPPALAMVPAQQPVQVPAQAALVPAAPRLININRAGPEELAELNGIGPALAARIIQDRLRRGPYRSVEDLKRVKGIGPSIMRKNVGRMTIQ